MIERPDPRWIKRFSGFSRAASLFSIAVGLSGLAGWKFNLTAFNTWGVAQVTMVANTAACFVLVGWSLWLVRKRDVHSFSLAQTFAARIAATVAAVTAMLSLAEHLFGLQFGIDQLLLAAPVATETGLARPGLMSPITAGAFMLLGIALLLIDWRTHSGRWPAQILALTAGGTACFGILSFLFAPHLYTSHLALALPTAITLATFSLGLICSRTEWGLGALLCSQTLGGSLARRLLPAVLVPAFVGWLRWRITATGIYSDWSIVVLATLTTMFLLGAIIAWAALAVERHDREREKVEEALLVSEEQLNRLLDRLDEPVTETSVRRKVMGGFMAAAILISFLGLLWWRNARLAEDDSDMVIHTHVVIQALEVTLRHLMDVETSGRGFAMSGHSPFLDSFDASKNAATVDLDTLRRLTADNPNQQLRLRALTPQVAAKIQASNELVTHRQQSHTPPTTDQLVAGKRLMDAAGATIQQMETEEESLLVQRTQKTQDARRVTITVMVLGSMFAMILLGIAGFATSHQIGSNARARARDTALNAALEQRVAQRTSDLQSEIAERKLAEQALKNSLAVSEQVLKELADQKFALDQHAIVAVTDVRGTITYVNHKFCAISQYCADELLGQNHRILNSGHHPNSFFQNMYRAIAGGKVWQGEIKNRAKDGSIYWVDTTIVPFMSAEGKPRQYVAIRADITERKLTEDALHASEERFQTMANSIPQLAWMAEPDGHIFWYNRRWFEFTGTTAEQMQGWGWQTVHDPEILPRVIDRWKSAIAAGSHFEMEFPLRAADGKFRLFLTRIVPLKDSNGLVVRWFGTNTDITEMKRVEEALYEQSKVLDLAQVLVRDMDSNIVLWSLGAEKLYGFTKQEAIGRLSHELLRTEFPEPVGLIVERLQRDGTWEGELVHRKRDGTRIVVSSLWVLHRNSRGEPARILEVNVDITSRKEVEERLADQAVELSRQAEELTRSRHELETQTLTLRSVLDSMAEGLVAADEQGNFIIWNSAAEKITGMCAGEMPAVEWNHHYGVFLPDGVTPFPAEENPLLRAIRGESATAEMYLRNSALPQGAWIESTANPLRDKSGALRGGVIAFRDVTQQRVDEREIRKLNDELEHRVAERTAQLQIANQELESFSYSVSHDLRAPLRHIGGFSKMLMEEYGSTLQPGARHYLDRIQAGTQKMGLLVDELLNLARVGRHSLNRRPSPLNPIILEVVTILEPDAEGRRVQWEIADLPIAECDPVLVKQIYQNLLANALKFTRARPHTVIEIGYLQHDEDGQTVFTVRDNGIGFNMKYVDKLFGVFQRLHRPEDFEGTGVGLATVQRIVQKHGGQVWAQAEVDKGATFFFTLGLGRQAESRSNGIAAGGQS